MITELNGEKIDIIQFSEEKDKFLKAALAPAEVAKMEFNKDQTEVVVTVPHDQLSLAIGRGGTNVKLAAKLVGLKVKIVSDQSDLGITVTGNEEFEIDQLGLSTKVRDLLVENSLTRIEDLIHGAEQLSAIKGIAKEDLELIKTKLTAYLPAEAREPLSKASQPVANPDDSSNAAV